MEGHKANQRGGNYFQAQTTHACREGIGKAGECGTGCERLTSRWARDVEIPGTGWTEAGRRLNTGALFWADHRGPGATSTHRPVARADMEKQTSSTRSVECIPPPRQVDRVQAIWRPSLFPPAWPASRPSSPGRLRESPHVNIRLH